MTSTSVRAHLLAVLAVVSLTSSTTAVAEQTPPGAPVLQSTGVSVLRPVEVTASSGDRDAGAANAVDQSLDSVWRATTADAWLAIDLGGPRNVVKVQQTFADDDVWRFVVEGSVDGGDWAVLVDRAAGRAGRTFGDGVTGVYRHLRLHVLGSAGGHDPSSVDFRAVGAPPSTDLTAAATATASTALAGYTPADAIDGNVSSYWVAASGSTPQWLKVDLGSPRNLSAVQQNFKDVDTWRFVVEGSVDDRTWTPLADYRAGVRGQFFHLPVSGQFRYVRLTITASASGFWADSTEFRVFGPGGAPTARELAAGTKAQSSSLRPGHEPFTAVDDDPRTSWQALDTTSPQTLTVDLGNSSVLSRIEQSFPAADTWSFVMQVSNDAAAWTTVLDRSGGATGRTFTADVDGAYRYVRLTVPRPSAGGQPAASQDLTVYGIGSPLRTRWWEDRSGVARFFPVWQGITLDEIRAQLDTLKAEGHNAIELAPIFEGNRDVWAGLGVTNLYNVHPDVGTFTDLQELLTAAHARDMKILFFANPGYAHESAPFFQKALRDFAAGVDSKERCWFDIRATPGEYDRWVYNATYHAYYWARWDDAAPSFHFAKQCWRDEVRRYVTFWMDKGFDGMIFDAPNVYHQTTLEYNNVAITDVMRNYDTFMNAEGAAERGFITDWHYNSLQDYSITQWAIPPEPGSSSVLNAIDSANPNGLENVLKGYRDEMVEAGGITQTPPNWGRRNYPVNKRLLEIATLTTMGTLFYVHNDYFTVNPVEQEFPHWTQAQRDMLHTLMKAQSGYAALAPSGLRVKLATNDNARYYAFLRTNKDGTVKAVVVLNFQASAADITVDLTNVGISTNQTPINLVTGTAARPITAPSYTIPVPAYGVAILTVD
ncbi:discoidin domain-containing protein [Actinophytocola oryzae]|uniref:Maltogenic amylase-like enzyme n=1 Tax=Actinophytocola oryzae TaxID=502181 RepID=A0A4R7US77_9PSEU|nr:discoidin domain-containing protein [Actinophytocola oryzae]TDV38574.1 maltogenic amylase-like enzyme [Actinophytocola oryzae]